MQYFLIMYAPFLIVLFSITFMFIWSSQSKSFEEFDE